MQANTNVRKTKINNHKKKGAGDTAKKGSSQRTWHACSAGSIWEATDVVFGVCLIHFPSLMKFINSEQSSIRKRKAKSWCGTYQPLRRTCHGTCITTSPVPPMCNLGKKKQNIPERLKLETGLLVSRENLGRDQDTIVTAGMEDSSLGKQAP